MSLTPFTPFLHVLRGRWQPLGALRGVPTLRRAEARRLPLRRLRFLVLLLLLARRLLDQPGPEAEDEDFEPRFLAACVVLLFSEARIADPSAVFAPPL